MDALVSVVIPFYNRFDLLQKTLRSVANQTYLNYEIILIDDASETIFDFDLIRKKYNFNKNNIFYEKLATNKGPGGARRRGAELAKGNFIAYLDSDDEWNKDFLARTIKILLHYPDVAMVFTGCLTMKNNKKLKQTKLKEGHFNYHELVFNNRKSWATGAGVWRKSISLPENWKDLRDHEDFVHDILSTRYSPIIYHISDLLCSVNKDHERGIKRSNEEMLRSFNFLLNHKDLRNQLKILNRKADFSSFILFRMSKRKYTYSSVPRLIPIFIALLKFGNYQAVRKTFVKILIRLSF